MSNTNDGMTTRDRLEQKYLKEESEMAKKKKECLMKINIFFLPLPLTIILIIASLISMAYFLLTGGGDIDILVFVFAGVAVYALFGIMMHIRARKKVKNYLQLMRKEDPTYCDKSAYLVLCPGCGEGFHTFVETKFAKYENGYNIYDDIFECTLCNGFKETYKVNACPCCHRDKEVREDVSVFDKKVETGVDAAGSSYSRNYAKFKKQTVCVYCGYVFSEKITGWERQW